MTKKSPTKSPANLSDSPATGTSAPSSAQTPPETEITPATIAHLAQLSNLSLTEAESAALQTDLQNIITYISQLNQLDTTGVEPTYQVFEMENVWRPDDILPQDADRAALLALAPATAEQQIKVPKVL